MHNRHYFYRVKAFRTICGKDETLMFTMHVLSPDPGTASQLLNLQLASQLFDWNYHWIGITRQAFEQYREMDIEWHVALNEMKVSEVFE